MSVVLESSTDNFRTFFFGSRVFPSSMSERRHNLRSRKRSSECLDREPQKEDKEPRNEPVEVPTESSPVIECAICLQSCVHPSRLPCGHIFCFLCLKGIAHGSAKCAMCRRPIPRDYFDAPDLLEGPVPSSSAAASESEAYQWFYEGRHGGWWQYEERTSVEIEDNHNRGVKSFQTLICGRLYTIDLEASFQFKSDNPLQSRKILRELPSKVQKRGVAGLTS